MKLNLNLNRYIFLFTCFIFFVFFTQFTYANSTEPQIDSEAAILIEPTSGKILYEKNSQEKMYPASTTKILTAILVLENANLNDVVTVSDYAATALGPEYASANLQYGEQLTVNQLLQILLVYSANDAAIVLAEHIGGSADSFISMMNTKVYELGLENTNFSNVYGGHASDHYTTAYDLAKIMEYCLQNTEFRKLAGSASCYIPATNTSDIRLYESTNDLIVPDNYNYYPYITTGKTGFTTPAGECLVTSSFKDDMELICVTLGGYTPLSRFTDTRDLFDYGYSNYTFREILAEDTLLINLEVPTSPIASEFIDLYSNSNIITLVNTSLDTSNLEYSINLHENISAPIRENQILGTVTYVIDDTTYTVDLISRTSVVETFYSYYLTVLGIIFLIIIAILITWVIIWKIFLSNKKELEQLPEHILVNPENLDDGNSITNTIMDSDDKNI